MSCSNAMAGLNSTVADAEFIHGTNPQFLVEKITRQKIYESSFWKQHCFGLNEETLLDKAVELKYIGGVYGSLSKPTRFLCLALKMLQLQPDLEVVKEYITQPDFKYLTALGLFYLRFIGKPVDIYTTLESFLPDYRKLRVRKLCGWQILHMDEFVDDLLQETLVLDLALPHLPMRKSLVQQMRLSAYESPIQEEWDALNSGENYNSDALKKRVRGADFEGNETHPGIITEDDSAMEGPPEKKYKGRHAVFDSVFGKKSVSSQSHHGNGKRGEFGGIPNRSTDDTLKGGIGEVEKGEYGDINDRKSDPGQSEKEGSVRWWNKRRKMLGLKPLNVPED